MSGNYSLKDEFDGAITSTPVVIVESQVYAIQLDESGTTTYIGKATVGSLTSLPMWQIQKLDESGSPELIITWADGDSNFDNIWDNRAALSYS